MDYVNPKTETVTVTIEDTLHTATFYKPPISVSGVLDESYAEYSNSTTYSDGSFVKIGALKKIFRCSANGTVGKHPLNYPDVWVAYGYLNSYRMLSTDEFISDVTEGTNVVIDIDFSRCNTMAFVGASFTSVRVQVFNTFSGTIEFDKEYIGRDYGSTSYADFYFRDFKALSRLVVSGFKYLPSATLRLTFSGDVKIAGLVYGNKLSLGATLMGTSLKFDDTSKVITSSINGARSVVRYGSVRVVECSVAIEVDNFNVIANEIDRIIGRNILWIPTTLDKFFELISIGYIESFDLPIENISIMKTKIIIIGVI